MFLPGETSLWLDEAVSVAIARLEWGDLWAIVSEREGNMSLYFVVLHLWHMVSDAELWLRGLSVVFSLGTIAMTYLLARRIVEARAAAASALVVAVNGLFLTEATQIRGYALAELLVVSSCYFLVKALQDSSRGAWALYAVAAGLSLYVHLFAGLVIAGQLVSLAWRGRGNVPWGRAAAAGAGVAVLAGPIVAFALFRGGQIGWIGEPTLSKTVGTFVVMAGGLAGGRARAAPDQILGLALTLLYAIGFLMAARHLVVARKARAAKEETWGLAFFFSVTVLPVALAFAVSIAAQPIFYYKYFAVILPMLAILVASGITRVSRRVLATGMLVAIVVLSLAAIGRCYGDCNREDWRDAADYVVARAEPDDAVLLYAPYMRTAFDYYATDLDAEVVYPSVSYTSRRYEETVSDPDRGLVSSIASRYERVWLVLSHASIGGDFPGGRLVSWLADSYGSADQTSFKGVRILLFEQ